MFEFVGIVDGMRGWGRGLRSAVANWYNDKNPDQLAYQLVKYQQRQGWSHRDVLRLSHAVPKTSQHDKLFGYSVHGYTEPVEINIIEGFEAVKNAQTEREVVNLIRDYGLTREMIPTKYLNSKDVWMALLEKMPMTALIRNLGKMSSIGIASPMSNEYVPIVDKIRNVGAIKKARVHPLNIYSALKTYESGHGFRGKLNWSPNPKILEALEDAFYISFENVEKTGKRFYLGLDVSSSMGASINNMPYVSAMDATALMALVTAKTEDYYITKGFSTKTGNHGWGGWRDNTAMKEVPITKHSSISGVIKQMVDMPFGGTDCALPMLDALENRIPVDTFVVYTDNETWAGKIHPVQALKQYRDAMGINSKLIVVGMTATGFSIADQNDFGMLDVVGFDTATPKIISEFSK